MNSRIALAAIIVVFLIAAPFRGHCAPAANQGGFWAQLKSKLEGFAPQKKAAVTTAVGGVRGSQDKSADTLYWKGESTLPTIAEDELQAFRQACQSADAGDARKALDQFAEFVHTYPESLLLGDARQALVQLQGTPPASMPAAVAETPTTMAAVPAAEPNSAAPPAPAAEAAGGATPAPANAPR